MGTPSVGVEERSVEEADHAALVFGRLGRDPGDVLAVRDFPDLLRLARGGVEDACSASPRCRPGRSRRRRGRRRSARSSRSRSSGSAAAVVLVKIAVAAVIPAPDRIPSTSTGVRDVVADRLPARALGDDRLERVRVRGGVDQHLTADREPDRADPARDRRRGGCGGSRSPHAGRGRRPSRRCSGRLRWHLRRGGRRGGRRSRARRACACASAGRSGRGRRSRWRRSARG